MKVNTFVTILAVTFFAAGCSSEKQKDISTKYNASLFTKDNTKLAFTQSVDLKTNDEIDRHILGKSFFRIPWVEAPSATTARDGLGPLFSANTCIHCHPNNGSGLATNDKDEISRSLVMRLSIPSIININNSLVMKKGFTPEPTYGGQFSLNGTSDTPFEGAINISYIDIVGNYEDKSSYSLQSPVYKLSNLQYGALHKDVNIVPHVALALIGLGAIESIPINDILANEDIDDKDNDGISGKANWVYNPESNSSELGRFTWKASAATVAQQTGAAAHNDMGLSNPLFPEHNCTPFQKECLKALEGRDDFDLPQERLEAIAYYLKTLKIPLQRKSEHFAEGEEIFNTLGCAKCHVSSFKTNDGVEIKPYSDFLLHDMGDALSDGHTMFKASANEFRTPPLWGIGLYEKVSGKTSLLHDARARSIEEAILWHGGEARYQLDAFKKLKKQDRDYLIEFLNSI